MQEKNIDISALEINLNRIRLHLGETFLRAFADPKTIELLLNPDGSLWQERLGESMTVIGTIEASAARAAMNIIATCLDTELKRETPALQGEFPLDGSRFAGIIQPVVTAPAFAIRKHASAIFTLDEYVETGVMTECQRDAIREAVSEHKNILVVGGTSSGKTTLTNGIIHEMVRQFPEERYLIAEDTYELQCAADNSITFRTSKNFTLTDILVLELRMRPDRLIVGEVRTGAALDLLDAWNTGHEGGIATLHANNAAMGLSRLRSLVSRHPDAPRVIEEVIGEAAPVMIHIAKTAVGRRVKQMLAVNGYANGQYQSHPVGEAKTGSGSFPQTTLKF